MDLLKPKVSTKKNATVSFRLENELVEEFRELAKQKGKKQSDIMRNALLIAIEQLKAIK